jgi:hypothetical protein
MRDRLGVFFIAATVAAAQRTPPAPTFRAAAKLVQVVDRSTCRTPQVTHLCGYVGGDRSR